MTTPKLQLPEVPQAILTASDELNAGLLSLDVICQLAVKSRIVTAPPVNAIQGDTYIIPAIGATGIWADRGNHVSSLGPAGWMIFVPRPGWRAWSQADAKLYVFDIGVWTEFSSGGGATSPLTTKGDLWGFSTLDDRLPIGTEGQVARVRLSEPLGIAYEDMPSTSVGEGASAARGYKTATQSIADSTLTAVTWPNEDFDTDAYHSNVTNNSRFTAAIAGKYLVGASIQWDANTTGIRELYAVVNGVTSTRLAGSVQPASAGLVQNLSIALDLAAADYIEFYVRQNSGGARDIGATERFNVGWITRVGVTAAPTQIRGATWVRPGTLSVPMNDVVVRCPVNGQIAGVQILTLGGPGNCVVDIWKDTYANFPPLVSDSICASNKPTISAGVKYEDTTLTGWTTTVTAGDVLLFHLESTTAFSAIFITLFIRETQ